MPDMPLGDDTTIDIKTMPFWLRAAIAAPLTAIAVGLVWFVAWRLDGKIDAVHADLQTHMHNRQLDAASMKASLYAICLNLAERTGPSAGLERERCRIILVDDKKP